MVADLSVYFFIAELFAVSLVGSSQLIPFLLLSISYGVLVFLHGRKFHKRYMLLPAAVLFLPVSCPLVLLPSVIYVLYLVFKEQTALSWDRQTELFSLTVKFFPIAGVLICFLGYYAEFVQYSLPMAFISLTSSVFLMRMLRQRPAVYLDPHYQRKNCLVFLVLLCMARVFSRDFVFRLAGDILSFVYMKGIYPVLNAFIRLFMGALKLIMYIFSRFEFGEIKFSENHLAGSEMGPTFKDVAVGEHVATTEMVFTSIVIFLLFVCAFYFFRWLALHKSEESFISSGFDIIRGKGSTAPKKERATTTVLRVRRQYRIFLKLYKEHGGKIETASTSADVLNCSAEILPDISADILREMRRIYLRARYSGTATKTDLKRMKQINKEIAAIKS